MAKAGVVMWPMERYCVSGGSLWRYEIFTVLLLWEQKNKFVVIQIVGTSILEKYQNCSQYSNVIRNNSLQYCFVPGVQYSHSKRGQPTQKRQVYCAEVRFPVKIPVAYAQKCTPRQPSSSSFNCKDSSSARLTFPCRDAMNSRHSISAKGSRGPSFCPWGRSGLHPGMCLRIYNNRSGICALVSMYSTVHTVLCGTVSTVGCHGY